MNILEGYTPTMIGRQTFGNEVEMKQEHVELYEGVPAEERGTAAGLFSSGGKADERRYKAVIKLIGDYVGLNPNKVQEPYTILDVGCGYAGLADYLPAMFEYHGIEEIEWIAEIAQKNHSDAEIECMTASELAASPDFHERFDFVIALGVIASVEEGAEQQFANEITVLAKNAVVISFLNSEWYGEGRDSDLPEFRSFSPVEMTALFKTSVSKKNCVIPPKLPGLTVVWRVDLR